MLVDVREAHEHAREHIKGAKLAPLSRFEAHDFTAERGRAAAAIFYCQSGTRTAFSARRFQHSGFEEIYVLNGGLMAWKRAGYATSA